MGRLITFNTAAVDAPWFFDDAYYISSGQGSYKFDWPSTNFPHRLCMHKDEFDRTGLKPQIRRWIENTISDTVIVDSMNMDYRKYYGKSYEWEKSHDVRNMWYRFSFEDEHSASMFALVFSEWIKLPTKWHPKYPEDEEYLSRSEEDRYVKG